MATAKKKPAAKKPARSAKNSTNAPKRGKKQPSKSIEDVPREPAPALSELEAAFVGGVQMTAESSLPSGPYVYALAYEGKVFYVGKGRGRRMFQHVLEALSGGHGPKCDRIRSIFSSGGEIEYRVIGEYETDAEAYVAERQFIAQGGELTNVAGRGAEPISPRDLAKQRFAGLLASMKPFHQWDAELSANLRQVATNVCGSTANFYGTLKGIAERGSVDPAPNFLFVKPDRTVRATWV